ncbi:hypothetical protein [Tessaracoccus sp. G1721]
MSPTTLPSAPINPSAGEGSSPRSWFARSTPLPPENATHRSTAFVYGNILVLAALVQVSPSEITGQSVVTVIATALSTFLVHIFAGVVTTTWSKASLLSNARDSTPILTAGLLPSGLLLLTVLFGVPAMITTILAELIIVVRIALMGVVVARLRDEPVTRSTVLAGIALAVLGLIIVVTKVVLIH